MWRLVAYDVVQPFTAAAAGFPSWGIGNRTERNGDWDFLILSLILQISLRVL
jgi:hypothetical protein